MLYYGSSNEKTSGTLTANGVVLEWSRNISENPTGDIYVDTTTTYSHPDNDSEDNDKNEDDDEKED